MLIRSVWQREVFYAAFTIFNLSPCTYTVIYYFSSPLPSNYYYLSTRQLVAFESICSINYFSQMIEMQIMYSQRIRLSVMILILYSEVFDMLIIDDNYVNIKKEKRRHFLRVIWCKERNFNIFVLYMTLWKEVKWQL